MPMIVVHREDAPWRDRVRSYKVFLDGLEASRVKNGETTSIPVLPGTHCVCIKIDWCRSPKLQVDVLGPQDVELICGPSGSSFSALYAIIFGRNNYIKLSSVAR